MQIIFLWTRDYHPFKENSFNFNGEFTTSLTIDDEAQSIKIDIIKNENFPNNFFGDSIENISCIIGKNGSGKTRILSLLEDIKTNQWYSTHDYVKILYNKDKCEFKIDHNLYNEKEGLLHHIKQGNEKHTWDINIPDGFENAFKEENPNEPVVQNTEEVKSWYSQKSQIVYYAPFLDLKNLPVRVDNKSIVDVSTDFLIITDKEANRKQGQDYLATHRFKNIERQFDFVTKFKDRFDINSFFEIPKLIEIIFLESRYNEDYSWNLSASAQAIREHFIGSKKPNHNGVIFDELHKIGGRDFQLRNSGNANTQEYKDLHLERVRMHFLKSFISHYFWCWNTDNPWLEQHIGIAVQEIDHLPLWDAFRLFLVRETWTKDNGALGLSFIDKMDKLLTTQNTSNNPFFGNATTSTENHSLLADLIKIQFDYLKTLPNYGAANSPPDIFQINWRNLSSGEKVFLDFFSRLNYANTLLRQNDIEKYTGVVNKTEWLYLLIDEGEVGFHPDWQKKFVNLLHQMAPFIFPDLKIQIILTSHSPFIASDVPMQNIIFLNKVDGKIEVNKGIKFTNSFAANIHTLLADGFFLSNGLIGDFARNRIQDVIDWLNNEKADLGLSVSIKKVIGLIGEPIVRNKLINMFNDKLGLDEELDKIKREIERLQALEIELNKKKNDATSKN